MSKRSTVLPAPWGEHGVASEEIVTIDVGPLRLNLRLRDDEIWIATTRVETVETVEAEPDESEPIAANPLSLMDPAPR